MTGQLSVEFWNIGPQPGESQPQSTQVHSYLGATAIRYCYLHLNLKVTLGISFKPVKQLLVILVCLHTDLQLGCKANFLELTGFEASI